MHLGCMDPNTILDRCTIEMRRKLSTSNLEGMARSAQTVLSINTSKHPIILLMIGLTTPPAATCLFVCANIGKTTRPSVNKEVWQVKALALDQEPQ